MGLDFGQCEASWSYGGFHRFRIRLAQEIGVDLESMEGFRDGGNKWDNLIDPIIPLLNHSDCDGELSSEDCSKVAPRLRQLVSGWDDDYDKRQALTLVEGMELCAATGEALIFC